MKTKMNFGWFKTALIAIVILGAIAITILDILMLVGVGDLATASPAVAGVSLAAAVLIAGCAILILFNSYYRFKDNNLVVMLGFFSDKLKYENIVNIKENSETKEVYILYKVDKNKEEIQNIRLNLSSKKSEEFLAQLRKYCPFIIVELFTPEKKNKSKK